MMTTSAMTLWLFAAAVAALIAFVYPYLIYPLVLSFLPRCTVNPGRSERQTGKNCTLLFCAFNEAESLPKKLSNLHEIKSLLPGLTISVYSDGSDDGTDELLAEESDLLSVTSGTQRQGKSAGLRLMLNDCKSDIIVLMDANTLVAAETFPRLLAYFDDDSIGAVTGRLSYINAGFNDNSATASVGGAYWRLEETIKSLETRSGSMMGADGALLAMRRANYPVIPPNQSDDMTASLEVMFDGLRCISAPDVLSFERAVENSDEEFARKRRVSCRSYTTHRASKERLRRLGLLDRFKWFSHRVMRWWGGVVLVASLLLFLGAFFIIGYGFHFIATIAVGGVLLVVLGRAGFPVVSQAYEIMLAITATTFGVLEALAGRRYVTWQPASSR